MKFYGSLIFVVILIVEITNGKPFRQFDVLSTILRPASFVYKSKVPIEKSTENFNSSNHEVVPTALTIQPISENEKNPTADALEDPYLTYVDELENNEETMSTTTTPKFEITTKKSRSAYVKPSKLYADAVKYGKDPVPSSKIPIATTDIISSKIVELPASHEHFVTEKSAIAITPTSTYANRRMSYADAVNSKSDTFKNGKTSTSTTGIEKSKINDVISSTLVDIEQLYDDFY